MGVAQEHLKHVLFAIGCTLLGILSLSYFAVSDQNVFSANLVDSHNIAECGCIYTFERCKCLHCLYFCPLDNKIIVQD